MPTVRPRIICTLPPHVFEVFDRLATLQGRSRGAVVGEILETIAPSMIRTVVLLEAAKEAHPEVLANIKRGVDALEKELVQSAGANVAQLDWVIQSELQGAKRSQASSAPQERRGPGTASKPAKNALDPRGCNTGVPTPKKPLSVSTGSALKSARSGKRGSRGSL